MNFQFSVEMMLIFQCVIFLTFNYEAAEKQNRETQFTIEVKGHYTDTLIEGLRTHDFNLLHKITPSVYIFQYEGENQATHAVKRAIEAYPDRINEIEKTRIYRNSLKPGQSESKVTEESKVNSIKNYGMGIPAVWAKNISGKGVIIAINDVGINTDLSDLERNINKELSMNFFTNTSDVTPESFRELLDKPPQITDHGNRVASVIAAIKGNDICSAGIAFDARIVALKILKVTIIDEHIIVSPEQITASDVISRSLTYNLHTIDVFVIAIFLVRPFDRLDLASRNALKYGATNGRKGLGTIYVVPAGLYGNELSQNNNTIAVNCIGINGTQPSDSFFDTSVLISGLRNGNTLNASSLKTASYGNKCSTDFDGTSVAVSQVTAIIALGLQANPKLTLRDVQHLLVRSADHESLDKTIKFQRNNATRYFHGKLGFGLVNAEKFVHLASSHMSVAPILTSTIDNYTTRTISSSTLFEFCHSCLNQNNENCLTYIEHVIVSINFTTEDSSLKMEIVSPRGTSSVIMDFKDQRTTMPSTKKGNIVSVHFWDEVSFGKWTIKVHNKYSTDQTKVHQISLILLGTRNADGEHVHSDKCDTEREVTIPDIDSMAPIYYVLAVVVSVVCICIIVSVICFWYRKRNNRPERGGNQSGDENVPMSVSSG